MYGLIMSGFILIMFLLLLPDPIKMGNVDGEPKNIDGPIQKIYHAWCKCNEPEEKDNNKRVDEQIKQIYHDSCNCQEEDNNKIEFMLLKGISLKQLTLMKAKWFLIFNNFEATKSTLEGHLKILKYPDAKIASNDSKTGSEIFFEKMQEHFANFNKFSGKEMRLKIAAELIGIINIYPDGLNAFNILQGSESKSESGSVVIELIEILAQFFKVLKGEFAAPTLTAHALTIPDGSTKRSSAIGTLSAKLSTLLHENMKLGKNDASGNTDLCEPILGLVKKRIELMTAGQSAFKKKLFSEFTNLFGRYCKIGWEEVKRKNGLNKDRFIIMI